MASPVSSNSASAAVVVTNPSEELVKRTEDALRMDSLRQRGANSPFEAFCTTLKICSLDDILTILPTILKGHESEIVEERLSAYFLSNALSENREMKKALTHLLEKTDCSVYYNSAKILDGLCSALENAGMHLESIQILIGASETQDMSLRGVACEHFCHLIRKVSAKDEVLADKMFCAAIYCLDSNDSKDLSVAYFEALFHDGYFLRKGVANVQLPPIIQQARNMLDSQTPIRVTNATKFFQEFMAGATKEQFDLLPEKMIEDWNVYAAEATEYEEFFSSLWEQYQKGRSAAVSHS